MSGILKSKVGRALAFWVVLTVPIDANALVVTDNTLTISSISITPSVGTASLDPWTAEASATVDNSLGQSAGQFDSSLGLAAANAAVSFVTAHGQADALAVTANASSAINLPGILNQAEATGLGNLFTVFTLSGGSGDVDVTFSMHLEGLQHGFADAVGSIRNNELIASLELEGEVVLFRDSILSGGPRFADTTDIFSTTLSDTRTLTFDTRYFVFIQADAESNGINRIAEPTGLALILAGLGWLACFRSRRESLA